MDAECLCAVSSMRGADRDLLLEAANGAETLSGPSFPLGGREAASLAPDTGYRGVAAHASWLSAPWLPVTWVAVDMGNSVLSSHRFFELPNSL